MKNIQTFSFYKVLAVFATFSFFAVSIFAPLHASAQILDGTGNNPFGVEVYDADGNIVSVPNQAPEEENGPSVNDSGNFFNNLFGFDPDGNATQVDPVTPPNTSSVNTGNSGSCSTTYQTGSGIAGLVSVATCILGMVIPLLIIAAIIVFLYGIVMYIKDADNSEKRTEGSKFMLYGIIALFVMVSMWALVGVLGNTFGIDTTTIPQLPN
jgi:uncharacterized membrane protein